MSGNPAGADGTTTDVIPPDPLCFVLVPFGRRSDATGTTIDFDAVYRDLLAPAIRAAELEPIRADEEMTGGIVFSGSLSALAPFGRLVTYGMAARQETRAVPPGALMQRMQWSDAWCDAPWGRRALWPATAPSLAPARQ